MNSECGSGTPERRRALRQLNAEKWLGKDPPDMPTASSLDRSLKKNTAFIKKVQQTVNAAQLPGILKDIRTVSLEKYLVEIIPALAEGILKCRTASDISTATEVVSALHQRFGAQFSPELLTLLLNAVVAPVAAASESTEGEADLKAARAAKLRQQKTILRLVAELCVLGVFRSVKDAESSQLPAFCARTDQPLPVLILAEILRSEPRQGISISAATYFVRKCGSECLEINSTEPQIGLPAEERHKITEFLKAYLAKVRKWVAEMDSSIAQTREKEFRLQIRNISYEAANLQELQEAVAKLVENHNIIASYIGVPLLPEGVGRGAGGSEDPATVHKQIWPDAASRAFYTEIPVLDLEIPPEVRKPKESVVVKSEPQTPEPVQKPAKGGKTGKATPKDGGKEKRGSRKSRGSRNKAAPPAAPPAPPTPPPDPIETLFTRLTAVSASPEPVSELSAVATGLLIELKRGKLPGTRLVEFLTEPAHLDPPIVPFLARFIAITHRNLGSEVTEPIVAAVQEKSQHSQDQWVRQLLLFAELVKFELIPLSAALNRLRHIIHRLRTGMLVALSVFLNTAGGYLIRHPRSKQYLEEMLGQLTEKVAGPDFSPDDRLKIAGIVAEVRAAAAIVAEPAEAEAATPASQVTQETQEAPGTSEDPPQVRFADALLYDALTWKTRHQVINLLLRLDWSQLEVREKLFDVFVRPELMPLDSLAALAAVLRKISAQKPRFAARVVDTVIMRLTEMLNATAAATVAAGSGVQLPALLAEYIGLLAREAVVSVACIFRIAFYVWSLRTARPNDWWKIAVLRALLFPLYGSQPESKTPSRRERRKNADSALKALKRYLELFVRYLGYELSLRPPPSFDVQFLLRDIFSLLGEEFQIGVDSAAAKAQLDQVCAQYCSETFKGPLAHFYSSTRRLYPVLPLPEVPGAVKGSEVATAEEQQQEEEEEEFAGESDDSDGSEDETNESDVDGSDVEAEAEAETASASEAEAEISAESDLEDDDSDTESDGESQAAAERLKALLERERAFDLQFSKVMNHSAKDTAKRVTRFAIPVPEQEVLKNPADELTDDANTVESRLSSGMPSRAPKARPFVLLARDGKQNVARSILVPESSRFRVNVTTKQRQQEEMKQVIKEKVMNYVEE